MNLRLISPIRKGKNRKWQRVSRYCLEMVNIRKWQIENTANKVTVLNFRCTDRDTLIRQLAVAVSLKLSLTPL